MILRALFDLFERLEADPGYDVAPLGRSHQKVSFVIVLERDGTLVEVVDARLPVSGKLQPRRVLVPGAEKPSGSGLNPCFLWDAPGYLLGWSPKDPQRAIRTFEAFRQRHLAVEEEIAAPEFSAVCRFLERWDPKEASQLAILQGLPPGYGVFQIRGETGFVHDAPRVAAWWDEQLAAADSGPAAQCLVTGEIAPIARLHPKTKGVDGAQTTGATIAGFNDPAYWSYGLTQCFNAPTSVAAAHRYVTALNALLDGAKRDKHRLVLGTTTVAFWTERPTLTEDIFLPFVAEGSRVLDSPRAQDEVVRAKLAAFLGALRSGREAYGELEEAPESTAYFILGLAAPTPARIAVRFFHRGTLADLLRNLRRHHADIGIERHFGGGSKRPEPEFPPARLLLDQTCQRKDGKPDRGAIPAHLPGLLLEAIVSGSHYPEGLFRAVMRRLVADREVNYGKACVIKGYLVRNLGWEVPMSLDTSRREPGYRLGRLFAVLEKTQQEALGSVATTIRDAYYAAASATPATVFPRLLRTYQHHLAKLEGGHKVNREKLVQEILDPLVAIPAHLRLAEQGLFSLGYYHQMNAFFTKKHEPSLEP
jgi:CRISPR-associated protein Csd1